MPPTVMVPFAAKYRPDTDGDIGEVADKGGDGIMSPDRKFAFPRRFVKRIVVFPEGF
jgi:hypothetical protein